MAFLSAGGAPTIFLDIQDETKKKLVRPLYDKPIQIWVHNVPTPETVAQLPNGKTESVRMRDFSTEICTAVDKRGTGCGTCNRTDPGWNYLEARSQTNKKGQRVDFPKRPVHLLPVWSYADNGVKVIRGGNQVYEEMDKWDSAGRNIKECDWMLWKQQLGRDRYQVKYHSQRMDTAAFSQRVTKEQVELAMKEAMGEYAPSNPTQLEAKLAVLPPEVAVQKFLESKAQGAGGNAGPALPPASTQHALPPAGGFGGPPPPPAQLPNTNVVAQAGADEIPPGISPQIWAILSVEQKAALRGGGAPSPLAQAAPSAAQQPVPTQPVQSATMVSGTPVPATSSPAHLSQGAGGNVTGTTSAAAQPTHAVSQPAVIVTSPFEYVLQSGKFAGKKLGEVVVTDPGYLKFFRSTQSPEVQALITAVLDAKPPMPEPVKVEVAAAAPTAAPVTTTTGQAQPPLPVPASVADTGGRDILVAECKQLIAKIPAFQGRGMGDNMIPFLRQVSGGKFDYTEWSIEILTKLKGALIEKLGGNPPADVQIAQSK